VTASLPAQRLFLADGQRAGGVSRFQPTFSPKGFHTMANVSLNSVRSGVRLLSSVLKEADNIGRTDGKVSRTDIQNLKDTFGDGGTLDAALDKVHRYAAAKTGKPSPTVADINDALSDAMRNIAKSDKNGNKKVDAAEERQLAATWKAVVEFSKEYKGVSIDQIVSQGHE
jgi:hypothetical protein